MVLQELDGGAVVERTVKDQDGAVVNLSGATLKQFLLGRPDGTTVTKSASFTTDGTDGKVRFSTTGSEMTPRGTWELQVRLTLPGGFDGRSLVEAFEVRRNVA